MNNKLHLPLWALGWGAGFWRPLKGMSVSPFWTAMYVDLGAGSEDEDEAVGPDFFLKTTVSLGRLWVRAEKTHVLSWSEDVVVVRDVRSSLLCWSSCARHAISSSLFTSIRSSSACIRGNSRSESNHNGNEKNKQIPCHDHDPISNERQSQNQCTYQGLLADWSRRRICCSWSQWTSLCHRRCCSKAMKRRRRLFSKLFVTLSEHKRKWSQLPFREKKVVATVTANIVLVIQVNEGSCTRKG